MDFRVIDGCPVPALVAPYFAVALQDALPGARRVSPESIYRGDDARAILHAHDKHTQSEVIRLHKEGVPGFGPANPVNVSTHCLFNDGIAYPRLRRGAALEDWQVGLDVPDEFVRAVIAAAARHGWHLHQPYSSGSERHHLNFVTRPQARGTMRARIIVVRARLPKH